MFSCLLIGFSFCCFELIIVISYFHVINGLMHLVDQMSNTPFTLGHSPIIILEYNFCHKMMSLANYCEVSLEDRFLKDITQCINLAHVFIKFFVHGYDYDTVCTDYSRSLISAFVIRCLDSIISLDCIAQISRL